MLELLVNSDSRFSKDDNSDFEGDWIQGYYAEMEMKCFDVEESSAEEEIQLQYSMLFW